MADPHQKHVCDTSMEEGRPGLGCSGLTSGVASRAQRGAGWGAMAWRSRAAACLCGNQREGLRKRSLLWGCQGATHNSGHKSTAQKRFIAVSARLRCPFAPKMNKELAPGIPPDVSPEKGATGRPQGASQPGNPPKNRKIDRSRQGWRGFGKKNVWHKYPHP